MTLVGGWKRVVSAISHDGLLDEARGDGGFSGRRCVALEAWVVRSRQRFIILLMALVLLLQVVDRLAEEEGMEGVREEVPGLLGQILGGELVMLEGLPDERIRCQGSPRSNFSVNGLCSPTTYV